MLDTLQVVKDRQLSWATRRGISIDHGSTLSLNDNLYLPLSAESIAEFEAGMGGELGRLDERGKMQALHSSSALVCNVFEYWRSRPMTILAHACEAPSEIDTLYFEKKYPTELRSPTPPHVDVALYGMDTKPFVIESKFTETPSGSFPESYFTNPGLWEKRGLPNCETLARTIAKGEIQFVHLDVVQLLKHVLGLATAFGSNFTLLYLWYEVPSDEAILRRAETELLKRRLKDEVDFRTMTYTELFDRLRSSSDIDERYLSYLADRYFTV